jgi:hypothetical protein
LRIRLKRLEEFLSAYVATYMAGSPPTPFQEAHLMAMAEQLIGVPEDCP